MKMREFLKNTAVKSGAIVVVTALVLTSSIWSVNFRTKITEEDLPVFVDTEGEVEVGPDGTPLAGAPKVTRTTSTKKSTKKVKMKKKATKTYTEKDDKKTDKKTETKNTNTETTTVETITETTVSHKYKKGSKIDKQTTTVKTTVITTVQSKGAEVAMASADSGAAVATAGTGVQQTAATTAQTTSAAGPVTVGTIASRVDSRVSNAYTKLGFSISVNPSVSYSGLFDARSRTITLKAANDTIYHELGHFVAFIAGNVDTSAAFKQIFEQEKSLYTAFNKGYALQNSSEYFAESFKNYTLDPAGLSASRPQTYAAIQSAVSSITDAQVSKVAAVYSAIWG